MTPPYGGFFINENYRQLTKITVNFRVNIYVRQDTKKLTKIDEKIDGNSR
jgi:hypothetical protein